MARHPSLPFPGMGRLWLGAVFSALCVAWPAAAQEPATEPPAHISHIEGTAVLERDGGHDSAPASMPLLAGDRVRTASGRVEILFGDGSTLHLDSHTVVDFQSDDVIRLLEGRVRLEISGPARPIGYRIDAPSAWVEITQPGAYRIAVVGGERDAEMELAVLRGAADLVNEHGRTGLRAGERAYASVAAPPSHPYVFNSAAWDTFDRWSEARRGQRLGQSAQYLPEPVRPYAATLDQHGYWRHVPTYGYVWYPTVHAGWRPYHYGRWATLRPFGWTWIGADPWAWPTHHFGRWGFSAGLWFWIPGRQWGPAWVSWAYAPGYISWCPLGWDNRPVIQFVNVNVYGGRHYDPWRAWTVVPQRRFGTGLVNVNVVNITRIDTRIRKAFVERPSAPAHRGFAVPRSAAPIRLAGTRSGVAVPRNAAAPHEVAVPSSRITAPSSGAAVRGQRSAEPRSRPGFPAPAREPGVPGAVLRAPSGETAPATAPDRGVRPRMPPGGPAAGETPRAAPRAPSGETAPATAPARGVRPRTPPAAPAAGETPQAVPRAPSGETAPATAPARGVHPRTPPTAPAAGEPPRAVPRAPSGGTAPATAPARGVQPRTPQSAPAVEQQRAISGPSRGSQAPARAAPRSGSAEGRVQRQVPAPSMPAGSAPEGRAVAPAPPNAPRVPHARTAPARSRPSDSGSAAAGPAPQGSRAVPRGGARGVAAPASVEPSARPPGSSGTASGSRARGGEQPTGRASSRRGQR